MANDDTIVLNPGVGGATTDASNVATYGTTPNIDRERVVIGGDASRAAVLDLSNEGASYKMPTIDGAAIEILQQLLVESRAQTAALRVLLMQHGVSLSANALVEMEIS